MHEIQRRGGLRTGAGEFEPDGLALRFGAGDGGLTFCLRAFHSGVILPGPKRDAHAGPKAVVNRCVAHTLIQIAE